MNRWISRSTLFFLGIVLFPHICPAPVIYRPGEGWTYEPVGSEGKWTRNRAKDQLEVAKQAFEKKDFGTAQKAANRVIKVWPLSDHAGSAQYLLGRCYEARRQDERAFKEYQRAMTLHPKQVNYDETLMRQTVIADRFLAGQWFKLWGYVPFFRSMDKTTKLYEDVVRNGPYHTTGPEAQLKIGTAREKQKDFPKAVKAYAKAADRYSDRPEIASEALFRAGLAYNKEVKTAEYDQGVAGDAINTFNDFKALYPKDPRITEVDRIISALRVEQARSAFQTAKFYENKRKNWQGAVVYYNESLLKDPNSPFAGKAREKIAALTPKAEAQAKRREAREQKFREAEQGIYKLNPTLSDPNRNP